MAEDTTQDTTEPDVDTTATDAPDTDAPEDKSADKVDRAELLKVIEQRDKIKAELRKLKGADKAKDADKAEPSEADTLRTALRRTAAVSVLSTRGITDKADQDAILSTFNLDALDISGTDVDTDTLADYLDTMKRVFGGQTTKRAPAVDTRRGSKDGGDATDPDTQRYRRIMGRA